MKLQLVLILAVALAVPATARAREVDLIVAALFGMLSPTRTFDVNGDAAVTAADLSARLATNEPMSTGCAGGGPAPDGRRQLAVGADLREYVVRLPPDYASGGPRAVVFGFHGFGGNAAGQEAINRADLNWPDAIGIYPEGLPRSFGASGEDGQGWQIAPAELDDRDLNFFDALLAQIASDYCINPSRVYVSGHSNGALFTSVLACTRGAVLAAFGSMSGAVTDCPGNDPVAAIISHGRSDTTVPYAAGVAMRALWIQRNGCAASSVPYAHACQVSASCPDDIQVAFCPYDGGHAVNPLFSPIMFRFFQEHARPA